MMVAEQYFSFESLTARSTCAGSRPSPRHDVVHADAREDLRILLGALGLELDHAIGDGLARLAQDVHDVDRASRRPCP